VTFTPEQVAALTAPLHKSNVKERSQAGRNLSYIEAWHAIAEANRIFGFDAWNRETVELLQLGEPRVTKDKYGNDQWRVGYRAKVRITVGSIVREGCGFGSGIDKDVDQAHESALKEAESDAMKRALMTFGNPFGLALYDKAQANVTSERPAPKVEGAVTGTQLAEQQASGRKIPAQAKRDGDHDRYRAMIDNASAAELFELTQTFDEWTAEAPVQWLDSLRDRMELRREELAGAANIADDEAAMDEAFRATTGEGGSRSMARNGRDHQAAA
jgi:DNA repair and recombination protein RAD52